MSFKWEMTTKKEHRKYISDSLLEVFTKVEESYCICTTDVSWHIEIKPFHSLQNQLAYWRGQAGGIKDTNGLIHLLMHAAFKLPS